MKKRLIISLYGLMGLCPLALGCFGAGIPPLAPPPPADLSMVFRGLARSLPAAPGGAAVALPKEHIRARRELRVFGSQLCIDLAGRPLAQGFVEAQDELGLAFENHRERNAIEQVIGGKADLALVGVALSDFERSYGVEERVYAYLLPALVTHTTNPITNLQRDQLRPLLKGKLSSWSDLGGGVGELHGYLAGPKSLVASQELTLMPGDRFEESWPMLSLQKVRRRVARDPQALGVTHLAGTDSSLRILAIDGVLPSVYSFRGGRYPFGHEFRVVYRSDQDVDVQAFLNFLSSDAALDRLASDLILPD